MNNGFGFRFKEHPRGIVISGISSGGACDSTGRINNGDLIVEINGKSLIGLSQEQVNQILQSSVSVRLVFVSKKNIPAM